ncbi:MAG TPA: threonine--tRNA ligase, partial [Acidobacteriota bacterium]
MPEINININGVSKQVPAGTSVSELLKDQPEEVRKKALAAKFNGKEVDLSFPLNDSGNLNFILPSSKEGLDIIRHSTSHLMAHAVTELFPDAQVGIGPVIEDGFYYDFKLEKPFTPEDLEKIEARMKEIVKRNYSVSRLEYPKNEALDYWRKQNEPMKVELIEERGGDTVSFYKQDSFMDLCLGPHVPSTGRLGVFKLLHTAGAYWRGDEKKAMLQRIYGTAWTDEKDLQEYLHRIEEA